MSLQREIILRYRAVGYVRFQIPALLCQVHAAKALTEEISGIEGVYRAALYRRQKKLSIQYDEAVCDFHELAKKLYQVISKLDKKGALKPAAAEAKTERRAQRKLGQFKTAKWANEKYVEAKETLQAVRILAKRASKKPTAFVKDPEKTIINFLNDVLVLYLVKIHWHRITQHWILHPLRYRYEWIAVFYLVYLLVRSRKQN